MYADQVSHCFGSEHNIIIARGWVSDSGLKLYKKKKVLAYSDTELHTAGHKNAANKVN